MRNKAFPDVRQLRSMATTDEKLDAQLRFKLLNMPRNGRLIQMQPSCGARKVQLLTNRHRTPILDQLTQPNIFLLKPFAEPRDGISLAGHRRRQEAILLYSTDVNIQ